MSPTPSTSQAGYLEQFLLLVKDTTGKATAAIIQRVLKHKQIFVFGELIDAPSVAQLKDSAESGWYEVLSIFAYGVYNDYKIRQDSLPTLNKEQVDKLRMLTIVSLASKEKVLSYDHLLSQLDITSVRELEDLVISCIYSDILRAKLNQKARTVEVQLAAGRDVNPDELVRLTNSLNEWRVNAQNLLAVMTQNVVNANQDIERNLSDKVFIAEEAEKIRKQLASGEGAKREKFDEYNPEDRGSMLRRGGRGKTRSNFGAMLRGSNK